MGDSEADRRPPMTAWTAADEAFMRQALDQAGAAARLDEIPVGAVVVFSGRVVATGHNRTIADADPSAHAEIVALRRAAKELDNHRLPGASLYVTLEPCTMCVGAMREARIARVVFGAYDERAGAAGSRLDLTAQRDLGHRIEANGGLLEEEAAELLKDFFEARR